jgi:uncharacterized protein YceK
MQLEFLVCLAAVALTAGCSSMPGHAGHHAGQTDYCSEYRATMAGKSIEEQRKASEAHIVRMHGTADAAHVERHMKMMEQRCGSGAPPPPRG